MIPLTCNSLKQSDKPANDGESLCLWGSNLKAARTAKVERCGRVLVCPFLGTKAYGLMRQLTRAGVPHKTPTLRFGIPELRSLSRWTGPLTVICLPPLCAASWVQVGICIFGNGISDGSRSLWAPTHEVATASLLAYDLSLDASKHQRKGVLCRSLGINGHKIPPTCCQSQCLQFNHLHSPPRSNGQPYFHSQSH